MKVRNAHIFKAACALLLLASCAGNGTKGVKAPIVLGDSSTIITETDPRYTRDMVADLHPNIPTKTHQDEDEQAAAVKDTTKPKTDSSLTPSTQATAATPAIKGQPQPAAVNGLTVAFKDVSVTIPGIAVKSYRNQDAEKANGVSYQLVSGVINNNRIIINSGTVIKISQRYQSQVVVNGTDNDLVLDNITTTTDWTPLPGSKNNYTIKGLDMTKLVAPELNATTLRNAITRAARRHRMGRKREQEFQASVRSVRHAGQRPTSVTLRSVMWKIDGKDANGKPYQKQIRVDMP